MAKKHFKEVYNRIANAEIGSVISTMHEAGIECNSSIESMLRDMGHEQGKVWERIFDWGTCRTYIKKLAEIPEFKEPKHNIKVDDFFYNSWGWEQTNIDFYQVVKVTESTVTLRAVTSLLSSYSNEHMSGKVLPCADGFKDDKLIRKTPYYSMGKWWVPFEYGVGRFWENEEVDFSMYA